MRDCGSPVRRYCTSVGDVVHLFGVMLHLLGDVVHLLKVVVQLKFYKKQTEKNLIIRIPHIFRVFCILITSNRPSCIFVNMLVYFLVGNLDNYIKFSIYICLTYSIKYYGLLSLIYDEHWWFTFVL